MNINAKQVTSFDVTRMDITTALSFFIQVKGIIVVRSPLTDAIGIVWTNYLSKLTAYDNAYAQALCGTDRRCPCGEVIELWKDLRLSTKSITHPLPASPSSFSRFAFLLWQATKGRAVKAAKPSGGGGDAKGQKPKANVRKQMQELREISQFLLLFLQ